MLKLNAALVIESSRFSFTSAEEKKLIKDGIRRLKFKGRPEAETRVRVRNRVENERSLRILYNIFAHRYMVSLNFKY